MEYAGLRLSCKLIYEEFDYEASTKGQEEFGSFWVFLRGKNIIIENELIHMFNTNTLEITIPALIFSISSSSSVRRITIKLRLSQVRFC